MKAYEGPRVFPERDAASGAEQAAKLPFFDCADLRPCLFQLVEPPGCVVIQHVVFSIQSNLLPQRTRKTQRESVDWVTGASEIESSGWIVGEIGLPVSSAFSMLQRFPITA